MPRRFPEKILNAIATSMVVGIRAGTKPHRFIAVWAVIVGRRVFIRSWGVKREGWHSVLHKASAGMLQVGNRKIAIGAIQTRSEQVKEAVDMAYKEKYNTPGSRKYVQDLCRTKSRNTTTELVPAEFTRPSHKERKLHD